LAGYFIVDRCIPSILFFISSLQSTLPIPGIVDLLRNNERDTKPQPFSKEAL